LQAEINESMCLGTTRAYTRSIRYPTLNLALSVADLPGAAACEEVCSVARTTYLVRDEDDSPLHQSRVVGEHQAVLQHLLVRTQALQAEQRRYAHHHHGVRSLRFALLFGAHETPATRADSAHVVLFEEERRGLG